MLKLVYGDVAVTLKTVHKRFERFRNGCESVEDEERSGRPSTSKAQENVERGSEMIRLTLTLLTWRIWWARNTTSRWQMGFNSAFKGLKCPLTLILLTWRIWWAPNNANRWQMGFISAFKGLNRRLIIMEIYVDLNISYGAVQNISTTDLNMRRVSAKFVPLIPPSWQRSMSQIACGTAICVK